MAPKDEDELVDMMFTATHSASDVHPLSARRGGGRAHQGPAAVDRNWQGGGDLQNFSNNGKRKVALFGLGPMCAIARGAAAQLAEEDFDVAVINPRFTKPIDAGVHEFFGRAADLIVTLEDHALMGGYGSAVLELFSEKRVITPVVRIGWPDQFIEHASTQSELRLKYGLSVENTVAKVKAQFAEAATAATQKLIEVA
jgi:1-deoxy-D-xylulose-5-phosphate synthase